MKLVCINLVTTIQALILIIDVWSVFAILIVDYYAAHCSFRQFALNYVY